MSSFEASVFFLFYIKENFLVNTLLITLRRTVCQAKKNTSTTLLYRQYTPMRYRKTT